MTAKALMGHPKLLLFNFILIQSVFYVATSTPKPRSETSLETLPPPAITMNTTQIGQPPPYKATPTMQGGIDESGGTEYEGDLDSSAANPDFSISRKVEEQLAAPSYTTVHQVWASSSSDSLDELSPEVISKLRNDVPFLAAYSIRPRLVGASTGLSGNNRAQNSALVNPAIASYTTQLQAPSTSGSEIAPLEMQASGNVGSSLQSAAASSPQSTLSKLGNFNEFKVETSSTSKSEHHHKRKTVLKRKNDDQQHAELRSKQRQIYNTANQLKTKSRKRNKGKRSKSALKHRAHKRRGRKTSRDLQRSGKLIKRAKSAARRNQAKTSRLRLKLNGKNLQHHMSIIKHGRYLQEQPASSNEPSRDGKASLDPVKGGDTDTAIKGGSVDGLKKTPFYSRAKPATEEDINADENLPDQGLDKNKVDSEKDDVNTNSDSMDTGRTNEEEEGADEDDESLAAPLPEPRRVGDADVEEDGDTVTVMPKYDGVDDDPEPVDDDSAISGEREGTSAQDGKASNGSDGKSEPGEDEPRARRVDRERPNDTDNRSANGGGEQAFGGGVGATTGGASGNSNGKSGSNESTKPDYDGEKASDDNVGNKSDEDNDQESAMKDKTDKMSTGVNGDDTSAIDNQNADKDSNPGYRDNDKDVGGPKRDQSLGGSQDDSRRDDGTKIENGNREDKDEDFSGREDKDIMRKMGEEELDVDYRDEMAAEEKRKTNKPSLEGEGSKKEASSKKDKDCDDGSYAGHSHHHDHGDHHHDHHDTIKWLQDAIPGEPGEDYPILSKVNSTNFNCRDQKYPGYYADVEARCQVSKCIDEINSSISRRHETKKQIYHMNQSI